MVSTIVSLVEPYYGVGICDKVELDTLKKIKFDTYDLVTNFLLEQMSIKSFSPTYTLYKVDIVTHLCSHHLDIVTEISNMYHTTLQATDKLLMLHTLSHSTLILFLSEHQHRLKRYVFLPVMFGHELEKNGHCASLAFDTFENKVYFIDPNGITTYFDRLLIDLFTYHNKDILLLPLNDIIINTEKLVEILFQTYIADLNSKFDTKFEFVSKQIWNKSGFSVNKSLSTSVIGVGHCVISTILINHLLHMSQSDISVIIKTLGCMPIEANIEIINNYSIGITDLVKQLK
jgi:hypothetical protein